ncbi:MAG: FHA domain-containing protein [Akkermansia sp.]|nr:FHA domain-containing protein [Akkermansia sp.]
MASAPGTFLNKPYSLLFAGIDRNGKALRFCIPFEELQSKRTIYIGRSGVCAIRFDREYKEVSRLHVRIRYEEYTEGNGYLYIREEHATTPTLVNGHPLYDEHLLMDGDELTFAGITLTFKLA